VPETPFSPKGNVADKITPAPRPSPDAQRAGAA
jgi:hypothetical protein